MKSIVDPDGPRGQRCAVLLNQYLQTHQERVDYLLAFLLAGQWVISVAAAMWLGPRAWAAADFDVTQQTVAALLLGSAVAGTAGVLVWQRREHRLTRHAVAVAQVLFSCLLIHITAGRIETHFHLFASLAFLSLYRDWRLLVTAIATAAIDHLVRGWWFPESIYGAATPDLWRGAEHLGWLSFEALFLSLGCRYAEHDMQRLAEEVESREHLVEASEEEIRTQTAVAVQAAEKVKVSSHARVCFVANVGRSLAAPLSGFEELTDRVLQLKLDAPARSQLEQVRRAARTVAANLSDLERITELDESAVCESVSLRRLVREATELVALGTDGTGAPVRCRIAADVPDYVQSDAARLRQTLTVLLSNVVAGCEGAVEMSVTSGAVDDEQTELTFVIADAVDDDEIDPVAIRWQEPTGHGERKLVPVTARQMIDSLGGTVSETGRLGEWTAVRFTVRCTPEPGDEAARVEQLKTLAGRRALVASPDACGRAVLTELLAYWEVDSTEADTPKETLGLLVQAHERCEPFDFLLLGMEQADVDLNELLRDVLRLKREGRTACEVLLVGSLRETAERRAAQQPGVAGFLPQSVDEVAIGSTLIAALEHPAELPPELVSSVAAEPSAFQRVPDQPLRILLAEDNVVNQQLLMRVLERDGHVVVPAMDGREAARIAREEPFDIAVIDIQMPGTDGCEATQRIRRAESGKYRLPIIGLGVCAESGDVDRYVELGMDRVVAKPVEVPELLHAMSELMEEAPLRQPESPQTAAARDEPELVKHSELLERVGRDAAFLDMLVVMFREDCPQRLQEIQDALVSEDFVRIRDAAHAITGTTGNVSAVRAHGEARRLMELAEQRRREDCMVTALALEQTLNETFTRLDELIAHLQTSEVSPA